MARPTAPAPPIVFARDEHDRFSGAGLGLMCRCGACGARVSAMETDRGNTGYFVHVGSDCLAGREAGLRGMGRQVLGQISELALPRWLRASFDYMDRTGFVHRFEQEESPFTLHLSEARIGVSNPNYTSDAILRGPELPEELHIELKCCLGDNVDSTALAHYFDEGRYALLIDVSRFSPKADLDFARYVAHEAPRDWLYQKGAEERYARTESALLERYEALMGACA